MNKIEKQLEPALKHAFLLQKHAFPGASFKNKNKQTNKQREPALNKRNAAGKIKTTKSSCRLRSSMLYSQSAKPAGAELAFAASSEAAGA